MKPEKLVDYRCGECKGRVTLEAKVGKQPWNCNCGHYEVAIERERGVLTIVSFKERTDVLSY